MSAETADTALQGGDMTPAAVRPLRRNIKFQVFWAGTTFGAIGAGVTNLALPLLILSATGSPALAGAFGAAQLTVPLLLGVPVGALADRVNRRFLFLVAEVIRTAAMAGLAAALVMHSVNSPLLLGTGILLGASQAVGAPVRNLVLRAIVHPKHLTTALAQDQARMYAGSLLGPVLGGILYGLGHVEPFAVSLACFGISLSTAALIRFDGKIATRRLQGGRGIYVGLTVLWNNSTLRIITAVAAAINLLGGTIILIVIVVLQRQHASSGAIGIALAGEAVGGIAGSSLVSRVHKLTAPGKLLLLVAWLCVPLIGLLAVPGGPAWVFVLLFVVALGMPSLLVMVDVLVFRQVEDGIRGRVMAATFMAFNVGTPLGSLMAGVLLNYLPSAAAILLCCAALLIPVIWATTKKTLRSATWPADTPVEENA